MTLALLLALAAAIPGAASDVEYSAPSVVNRGIDLEDNGMTGVSYRVVKIGSVKAGKYQGGELLRLEQRPTGPCRGPDCDVVTRLRFVRRAPQKELVFLPRISAAPDHFDEREDHALRIGEALGCRFKTDKTYSIPALEYPTRRTGRSPSQFVVLVATGEREADGLATGDMETAFSDASLGAVEGLRPAKQKLTFYRRVGDVHDCRGTDCYESGALFVFRPDGTYLKYVYPLEVETAQVQWTVSLPANTSYSFSARSGCDGSTSRYTIVVPPGALASDDLVAIGRRASGETVFGFKKADHPVQRAAYDQLPDIALRRDPGGGGPKATFEEFARTVPVIVVRDGLGRWLAGLSDRYLPPPWCARH